MFIFKKFGLLIMATILLISCSKDDNTGGAILHQNFVQGELNNHNIAISDINANILIDKSDYEFSSGNQIDIPAWFDWEVKLIETKDTCITLYLHIDDVKKANEVIHSPNEEDPIKTRSTCYATVKDLKNNTTYIFHPTLSAPIDVIWRTFMMTTDNEFKNSTKDYDYKLDFTGHRWPGIEGNLQGMLTSKDASQPPLKIKIKFILY